MNLPLTTDERELFHQLIAASRVLVTTTNLAATVLSEEFESQVTGPASVVEAILDKCPLPDVVWDGEFRIEDCDEKLFTPDVPEEIRSMRINTGVELTHRVTGASARAYSSSEVEQNRQRAARALKQIVERRFRQEPKDPLR